MKKIKIAAIFDMDGVLVNNMHFHELAFYELCRRHDREITREFFLKHIAGSTNELIMPKIFGQLPELEINRLAIEKETVYREMYAPEMRPSEGLVPFLEYLKSNDVKVAVASNAPMENIVFVIDELGLNKYIDVVVNALMVENPKPAPDMFLKAADLLNAFPEHSVVFEDAPGGIRAANTARMKAIGLLTSHSAEELGTTHITISDFTSRLLYDFWGDFLFCNA